MRSIDRDCSSSSSSSSPPNRGVDSTSLPLFPDCASVMCSFVPLSSSSLRPTSKPKLTPASPNAAEALGLRLTHIADASVRKVEKAKEGKGVEEEGARGGTHMTLFQCVAIPTISIVDYVKRIRKHFNCSNECFVLAWAYINSLNDTYSQMNITLYNAHRLVVTAVMVAAKFVDDVFYSNRFYASVAGVPSEELNSLEMQLLCLLQFDLYVSSEAYERFRLALTDSNILVAPLPTPSRNSRVRSRGGSRSSKGVVGSEERKRQALRAWRMTCRECVNGSWLRRTHRDDPDTCRSV